MPSWGFKQIRDIDYTKLRVLVGKLTEQEREAEKHCKECGDDVAGRFHLYQGMGLTLLYDELTDDKIDEIRADHVEVKIRIKKYWYEAGRTGRRVGPDVHHDGLDWTPVIWDDDDSEEGLCWFKSHALEVIQQESVPK